MQFLTLLFAFLLTTSAYAFSVSPMTAEFESAGSKSTVIYSVTNSNPQPLAIEIKIESRSTTIDGQEINDSSEQVKKLFTVFPSATLIKPNQEKGIRITYVGPRDLPLEKSFRISIIEKPSKGPNVDGGVKMMQLFRTSAYVSAPGLSKSSPATPTSLQIIRIVRNKDKIKLVIKNQGLRHFVVRSAQVRLKSDKNETFSPTGAQEKLGLNFLASEEREIELDIPPGIKGTEFQAELTDVLGGV